MNRDESILIGAIVLIAGGMLSQGIARSRTTQLSPEERAAVIDSTYPVRRFQLPALSLIFLSGYLSKSPVLSGCLVFAYFFGFGLLNYRRVAQLRLGSDYMRSRRFCLAIDWASIAGALAFLVLAARAAA